MSSENQSKGQCCSHSIRIINLKENDLLTHTIVFVRGEISGIRSNCSNEVFLRLGPTSKQYKCYPDRRSGSFKLLLDLTDIVSEVPKQGLDIFFNFTYCSAVEHTIKVTYKDSTQLNHRFQPVYLLCQGEQLNDVDIAKNLKKIDLNLRLVQSIFADRLIAAGFQRRSFAINNCICFFSQLNVDEAWAIGEHKLWEYFAEELIAKYHSAKDCKLKFVAFIACTKYDGRKLAATQDTSYENIKRHLHGHAALGGGGLALFGSAYFYCWPQSFDDIIRCISDEAKVDVSLFPDTSNYRGTYGANYASSLGAVCHEIGHTLGLGHDLGIMGNGVDYLNRLLTNNNLTENLPSRVFETQSSKAFGQRSQPRFTRIRHNNDNKFLETYHRQRQKDYDEFYFTKNCALILFYNKWLSNQGEDSNEEQEKAELSFDLETGLVTCDSGCALSVIEIRNTSTSCVVDFIAFNNNDIEAKIDAYKLPEAFWKQKTESHYLFVATTNGQHARFELKAI